MGHPDEPYRARDIAWLQRQAEEADSAEMRQVWLTVLFAYLDGEPLRPQAEQLQNQHTFFAWAMGEYIFDYLEETGR